MATPCSIEAPLTAEYLKRASAVFKDILLKCRHWGAVEGCCVGFTKFCAALLSNGDPELQEVPARMLKQGLSVLQAPRGTSVTRRAAGLPMLILCVAAAEDASKSRPLLALSVATLLETAGAPVPQSWDQTVDLPQVCAVHTLQALVRGSGLGVAVPVRLLHDHPLPPAPQLPLLGHEERGTPALQHPVLPNVGPATGGGRGFLSARDVPPGLLRALPRPAALPAGGAEAGGRRLGGAPWWGATAPASLPVPVLTLLGKLQPGVHDEARCLSAFLPPLLRLAASSIHNVRTMAARALVVMTPRRVRQHAAPAGEGSAGPRTPLPQPPARAAAADSSRAGTGAGPGQVRARRRRRRRGRRRRRRMRRVSWLCYRRVTSEVLLISLAVPLIRSSYLSVCALLARFFSASFLDQLQAVLLSELQNPSSLKLQIGSASFLQNAVHFLCEEAARTGDSRWAGQAWRNLPALSADARLSLVGWAADGRSLGDGGLQRVVEEALRENLKVALQDSSVEYRRLYLAALVAVLSPSDPGLPRATPPPAPRRGTWRSALSCCWGPWSAEGGPELLSQSLRAVSLLLAHCSSPAELTQRWCGLLEVYRAPEAPEVLRLACAQALRLAGAPVVSGALGGHSPHAALAPRLLGTALHLLQDEDAREFWDSCHTLEALLGQLPRCGLSALLGDVQLTACASLYEQDEPNVFAEPAVMSERLLPYLLRLAAKVPESPCLADRLLRWARENVADVQENVGLCKQLYQGETAAPAWLALAVEPRFHRGLCGLFARAGLLLELLDAWEELRSLCCPLWLRAELQQAYQLLYLNGVLLPESIPANIGLQRPA
ncbi:hypothetical protein ANANG_G00188220 [Anguilla anguilla]|uniref:DUF2428 domain-containing protein n=1 Tax=Anguilla anguilla TaxID=7936 RepID=A0A9D3M7Q9_ANGAN|nr:hypothetical protein ANANG_G00188220 [Anguilla anguilla]